MPWSSNATYLCEVRCGDDVVRAIYKPRRGERPLWDFPSGLDHREVAAYELSEALGWDLVPLTILRDGPLGSGSVQLFVDADFEQHYFTLYEDEANHDQLRAMCAFDLVGNNTDRKSGHCLLGLDGRIRGIDHGLMFHHEFKLRTVIWEFGGEPVPEPILVAVDELAADELPDPLARAARPLRARRRARPGPGARARRLLPDRRDRPPLPLAARLALSYRRRRRRRPAAARGGSARPRCRGRSGARSGGPARR